MMNFQIMHALRCLQGCDNFIKWEGDSKTTNVAYDTILSSAQLIPALERAITTGWPGKLKTLHRLIS